MIVKVHYFKATKSYCASCKHSEHGGWCGVRTSRYDQSCKCMIFIPQVTK